MFRELAKKNKKQGQMESWVSIMQYVSFIRATFPVIQLSFNEKDVIVSPKALSFMRGSRCVSLF